MISFLEEVSFEIPLSDFKKWKDSVPVSAKIDRKQLPGRRLDLDDFLKGLTEIEGPRKITVTIEK